MDADVVQRDASTGFATLVHTDRLALHQLPDDPIVIPLTDTPPSLYSTFKSANRTTAGTTIITEPIIGGSLHIIDLLISGQKFSAGSVTVQFTDGTETVIMFKVDLTDVPIALAVPLKGRWQGWVDARLEMVTAGDPDVTVAVSYMKHVTALPFAEWDSFR